MKPPASARFLDQPRNIAKILRVFYALCGLLVLVELVVHRHSTHPWEGLFAFYALYGFVACVLLVVLAKGMRLFLMRGEDYYGDD